MPIVGQRSNPPYPLLALSLAFCLSCGAGDPPPKSADDGTDRALAKPSGPELSVRGEVGALDANKVDGTFRQSIAALTECLHSGASRVEFLGGTVSVFVKIDQEGRLIHAHFEDSTLGDRDTEKCMLDALRGRSWPAPVGGDIGYARKSFDFDPPNDVRPPVDWAVEYIESELARIQPQLNECKSGARGEFGVTMYVDTDGHVLSVGAAPPDEDGEAAVDCLVRELKEATFPSPGSWPAKVRFAI